MKSNKIKLTVVMMVIGAVMLACSIPLLISPVTPPVDTNTGEDDNYAAQMTQIAADVMATLNAAEAEATSTPLPTNTLVPTSTPLPTSTPRPTKTPAPTSPPKPCNAAEFIRDMTVVDGSALPKNSPFTKIWRLKNVGSCTWTKDYEITFDGGDKLEGSTVSLPESVSPGEIVDIAVPMKAPDTTGRYKGYWILRNAHGVKFGLGGSSDVPFYVELRVVDTDSSTKYNFADKVCKAEWKTDTHTLPCLGNSQAYSNYVLYSKDFELENGKVENEPAIIANVETGARLRGNLPAVPVAAGDRFVSEIGCVGDHKDCKVKMVLRYRINGTSTSGVLGEWLEKHDGNTTLIDIDLTSLAGEDVVFTLDMEAKSDSDTNEVFWFMPSIRN